MCWAVKSIEGEGEARTFSGSTHCACREVVRWCDGWVGKGYSCWLITDPDAGRGDLHASEH